MEIILNETASEVVQEAVTVEYNSIKIKAHNIDDEAKTLDILYRKYMNGVELEKSLSVVTVSGQDFLDLINAQPTPGLSRAEDIHEALHVALLKELNLTEVV